MNDTTCCKKCKEPVYNTLTSTVMFYKCGNAACLCHRELANTPNEAGEWEKEFDEKFPWHDIDHGDGVTEHPSLHGSDVSRGIKSFITQAIAKALLEQRESIRTGLDDWAHEAYTRDWLGKGAWEGEDEVASSLNSYADNLHVVE